MTGRMFHEGTAKIAWAFVFIGFNVTFFSQFIMGSQGMPRRYYDYLDQFEPLHMTSSGGAYILGVGFVIMLLMFIHSLMKGEKAPANPWGSIGYEWATPGSRPSPHNFHETPVITRGPYDYHLASEEELRGEVPAGHAPAV
jgi:cytochrome c oxidase subunit 1